MTKLPNFLIIGAQKSGTTSLYEYLNQHPDIFMSEPKEPRFFADDKRYAKGLEYYSKFFVECSDEKMIGEASTAYTSYLNSEKIIQRIHKFNPNLKLIYILRNPISRAYSAYWWSMRVQDEPLDFYEAILQEEKRNHTNKSDRIDQWSYKRRGLYFHIIEQYLKYFPKENLKVILLEDLKLSAIKTCNDVFEFLNLKEFDITILESDKMNKAILPSNKSIQRFMNNPSRTLRLISFFLESILGSKKKKKLHEFINKKTLKTFEYSPMKESTFEYLVKYFESDIKQLENFLNRDLSHWINSKEILCGLSK